MKNAIYVEEDFVKASIDHLNKFLVESSKPSDEPKTEQSGQ